MKKLVLIIFILFFFSSFIVDINLVNASDNIHYVGGNKAEDFTSIQEAIDNASAGDTVFVYKGVYSESIDIYKKINLVAEKGAVLDYNNTDDIVTINADGSRINGFIIRNCSGGIYFGINIEKNIDDIVIENNVFKNNSGNSIYLYYASDIKILNNTFYDDGIFIVGKKSNWDSHTILNNTVGNQPIFYYNNMVNLNISKMDCGQIILANCTDSVIRNNNVSNSKIGIYLGFSNNNTITENNLINNIFGIRLQYSDYNNIENNSVKDNDYGVYIQHSQKNLVSINNISYNNMFGCYLCCDSRDNIIYLNNFIFNDGNAYDVLGNFWNKDGLGNYWDDYSGFDKNSDFIGDIGYNISFASSDFYPLIVSYNNYIYDNVDGIVDLNGLKENYDNIVLIIFIIIVIMFFFVILIIFKKIKIRK
jgi:parallel beta-helix repeat protein